MKRIVIILITLLVITGIVWAGGKQESGEGPDEAVTLNFWFPTASEVSDQYFIDACEEFSKTNPNINVIPTAISSHSKDMEQKLNTARLGGTFPDVFSAVLMLIGTRGALGDFYDLTDLVDAWEDKADIVDSAMEMGYYKGRLIGLGYFPAPIMNVYRKDFFAEAGLDPNQGPDTWEELKMTAKKASVYDSDGNLVRAGFDLPKSDAAVVIFEAYARNAGSAVIDEINQKPAFTDDATVEGLQFLGDLYQDNVSFPFHMQDFGNQPFINNRSAIGQIQTNQITSMVVNDPEVEDQLGYTSPMEYKVKKNFCGYRLFTIGSDTKYADESWEFVQFMMSAEQMEKRTELLGIPPARKSLSAGFISKNPERNASILEYIEYGKGKPITPWTSIYNTYLAVAYEQVMAGDKTAKDALMEAETGLVEELKKFGYLD